MTPYSRTTQPTPPGLGVLHDEEIDVLLTVEAVLGWDSNPDSAVVRLLSTATGQELMALSWKNGGCGMKGSPCDRRNRMVSDYAAAQMVPLLERALLVSVNGEAATASGQPHR